MSYLRPYIRLPLCVRCSHNMQTDLIINLICLLSLLSHHTLAIATHKAHTRTQHSTRTMVGNYHASLLAKLTELNSVAVDQLCEGSMEEGEAMLSSGLAVGLQEHQVTACVTSPQVPSVNKTSPSSLMTVPLVGVLADDDFPMDAPHTWFCLYQYAFGLLQSEPDNMSSLVAMLAYNLAMVHHQIGLVETDFKRLVKARQLYELAVQHVSTAAVPPLLTLAIYNNMGHLCSFFGDTEGIQLCRNALECGQHVFPCLSRVFEASLERARHFSVPLAPAA